MKREKMILKGVAASGGVAKGAARIIISHKDLKRFQKGDVLVTYITDPSMVVMMNRASAIICDIGSITSHPSIVSRELGIPCVVNVKKATKILKDGMKLKVDGNKGKIYILR